MAGHSKWANIKHKKAAVDAKRGKVFSAISKKISSAARRGGGDPETNVELRLYLQKARAVNMPQDNIKRVILKATGQLEGVIVEAISYEGYGAGGVAIYVEGSTDNKNRIVGEVRYAFSRNGGNLGTNGSVAWMFHTKGILVMEESKVSDLDELMELALENGAADFETEDGMVTITTEFEDYLTLREALIAAGYTDFVTDEITKVAENSIEVDLAQAKQNMRLIELLEDNDDIENVYHNMEISDEIAEQL